VIKKVLNFIRESREELKKVTWPDRDEVASFTMVVIISVIIISLFLWFVDTLLGKLISTVMN
jgi:preprotein translocase subunit SecE